MQSVSVSALTNELIFYNLFIIICPLSRAKNAKQTSVRRRLLSKSWQRCLKSPLKPCYLFIRCYAAGRISHNSLFRHNSQVLFGYQMHRVTDIHRIQAFSICPQAWGRLCFIIPHAQYYDGLALHQGELEGGRHLCWQKKVMEVLCMYWTSIFVPVKPTQAKTELGSEIITSYVIITYGQCSV